MIPLLETDRLVLRGWRQEDFESYARFMADPEVARYLSGDPLSRTDAWRNMAMIAGHWALRGYGMWAVERKSDRAVLGRAGLWNPEGWPGLEIGWTFGREYWKQGYATEAGRAVLNFGFLTQPVERLISVIHVDNRPSQRVAERLGETRGERREIAYQDMHKTVDLWTISREDWARKA